MEIVNISGGMKMKTNLEKKMIYLIPCLNLLQLVAVSVALFCTDSFNPVAKTIMALVTAAPVSYTHLANRHMHLPLPGRVKMP